MKMKFHLGWFSRFRNELFGLSVLQIIFFHYTENLNRHMKDLGVPLERMSPRVSFLVNYHDHIGSIGLEIFLILSGMGLYYSFSRNPDLKRFYTKRYRRVLIPYFIIATPFWFISDCLLKGQGAGEALKDLLFVTFFTEGTNTIWFILLIAVMYLVFPLIYRAVSVPDDVTSVVNAVMLMTVASSVTVLLRMEVLPLGKNISIAMGRIPDFILGVYLGKYIKKDVTVNTVSSVALGAAFVLAGYTAQLYLKKETFVRVFTPVYAIGFMILLSWLLYLLRKVKPLGAFLRFVGAYSLEIYVCHVTLRNLMDDYGFAIYRIRYFSAMIAVSLLLAWLLKRVCRAIPE